MVHQLPAGLRVPANYENNLKRFPRLLSDISTIGQRYVIAQLIRNKYAIDYFMNALNTVKEHESIYHHEVKKMLREAIDSLNYYEADLRSHFTSEDPWEMTQDAAYEYWREIERMVRFHELAVQHILLKEGLSDCDWISKLGTAKTLLNFTAYIDGLEGMICEDAIPMLKIGAKMCEFSSMSDHEKIKGYPSAIGHIERISERFNLLVLKKLKLDFFYDMDTETERSMDIAGRRIQETLMNYDLMWVLLEDHGHTLEEAKQIIEERKQKIKENKAKEAKKNELKAAKKAAKQQSITNNNNQ